MVFPSEYVKCNITKLLIHLFASFHDTDLQYIS